MNPHRFVISNYLIVGTIAVEIPFSELAHLKAAKQPEAPRSGWVVPCIGGLVQVDLNAVDIASEAHAAGLRSVGALRPSSQLLARQPFPRTQTVEALKIDDHVGLAHH